MRRERVLFLCTGNSCRSQMAEGLLKYIAGDRFDVFSAGVNPVQVNPAAIRVMDEVGIDISEQRSKSVDSFLGQQFDYVITLCDNARQTCPILQGRHVSLHWSFEDPAIVKGTNEEKMDAFRIIRDAILRKLEGFIKGLSLK